MRKRHGFTCLLLVAAVLCVLCAPAYADFGYSGALDPETGEPLESSTTSASSTRVTVSDGVVYDRDRRGYLYTVGDSAQLLSTVVDGMVVQGEVRLEPDEGMEVTLYKNGTALDQPDLTHIYETGDYVVEETVNGQKYQTIAFSIVGDVTCRLSGYTMPSGFTITNVTLDDQEIYFDRGYVSMEKEGHYVVDYTCTRGGRTYTLDVTVDTTPPTLALAELNEKNQARGPVSLADVEEGASIGITLDGKSINYTSELTESGEYSIVLMDRAGNVTNYNFTILLYFNWSSLLFFAIVLGVAIAVTVYIVVSRKTLTVR